MSKFWLRKTRRVLIDIDTQIDLITQLSDWKRNEQVRNVRQLMAWVRYNKINVISTALSYRASEINGDGKPRTLCIEGSPGQKKIAYTLLPSRIIFEPGKSTDLPSEILKTYQQVIFEKRTTDTFSQLRADRLLTNLHADEFIVIGTQVETAMCATVLGLISRRKPVYIVTDAIFANDKNAGKLALRKMEAKGAKLITSESLTGKRRNPISLPKLSVSSG